MKGRRTYQGKYVPAYELTDGKLIGVEERVFQGTERRGARTIDPGGLCVLGYMRFMVPRHLGEPQWQGIFSKSLGKR